MSDEGTARAERSAGGALRIGVSSCLLGRSVRYDGGHKRDRFLTDQLGPFVEWVPVCPELEVGMSVPRPALRLVRERGELQLREIQSGRDHSAAMRRYAARRLRELRRLELCGYVLKKNSPSCGMERVRVTSSSGAVQRVGRGLFAAALLEALPELPVEEEGRLCDPGLRENFIERVFAYQRLRALWRGRWSRGRVVAFHTAHKLQLMAHAPRAYAELGRWVADVARHPRAAFREHYSRQFMRALTRLADRGRGANVLQHAAGHLRGIAEAADRQELAALIEDYRCGFVPLVVPVTLLAHHARRHSIAYLLGQTYLAPHPRELMLRNHV